MAQRKLTEQEMNYEYAKTSMIWRNISKILGNLFRFGCIFLCAYFFFDAIKAYSGKETYANILLDAILNLRFDKWIGYVFGVGCLIYSAIRNKQLKETRKSLSEHIRALEKRIDPERQKSRLNQYGETYDDK